MHSSIIHDSARYLKNRGFEEYGRRTIPGLENEGSEESSVQVVGRLQENGPFPVHAVLPSVRLQRDGQSGGSDQVADKG